LPQLAQNLPVFLLPHSVQNHSAAGLGEPHSGQNLPVQTAPQAQVQLPEGAGLGEPHSEQNLPVLVWPQEHVQPFAGAAIVHAHTTNTIFRSLIEDEIEMVESEGKFTIDGPVKVFAPEVSIASPEAAEMLAGAVREGAKVAVLRGHGPFAVADDLFGAQRLVSVLEQSATVANLRDATGKAFL
jgi:hypothetical protein